MGCRIGGAEVTHRHANILINRANATAADVRALIQYVQDTVQQETGYRLEPEISFVGEFSSPTVTKPTFAPKPEGVITAAERARRGKEHRDQVKRTDTAGS